MNVAVLPCQVPGTETLLVTGQGQETFSDRPGTGDI